MLKRKFKIIFSLKEFNDNRNINLGVKTYKDHLNQQTLDRDGEGFMAPLKYKKAEFPDTKRTLDPYLRVIFEYNIIISLSII